MIKINEADLAKLKEAIRENTKQLEKLAEQVRQMSQATTIWGLAKSPEIGTEIEPGLYSAPAEEVYREPSIDGKSRIAEMMISSIRRQKERLASEQLDMPVKQIPDSYFDGKSIKEIEPPPLKGWLQRQQEMALEDERVFAAMDNASKEEKSAVKPKTVLFACVHNAGRSQMAAALFDNFADLTKASAISAGSNPASNIYPNVIEVMKEVNCDETYGRPQLLTEELAAQADLFISMGCGEAGCPIIPAERIAWQIEDPKDQPIEKVRQIRDQIREQVLNLLDERGWLSEWARREWKEVGIEFPTPNKEVKNTALKQIEQYANALESMGGYPKLAEVMADQYREMVERWRKEGGITVRVLDGAIKENTSNQTAKKLIITPKNIERLILWRQALISRTTISQSMMEGAIALIHYQLHATHNFNVPEEYRTAHIQFMAYSQEDQETMIENTLIDNEIV